MVAVVLLTLPPLNAEALSAVTAISVKKTILIPSIREMSGLTWSSVRNRFFAIGDEGDLIEFGENGTVGRTARFPGRDFEALALSADQETLYILDEKGPEILAVSASDFRQVAVMRPEKKALRKFAGARIVGFEGLAVDRAGLFGYPGALLLANQAEDPDAKRSAPSGIIILSGNKPVSFVKTGITDCSDIALDPAGNRLWCLSDQEDRLIALRPNGTTIAQWDLPPGEHEGLAWNDSGLWISDEDGTVRLVVVPK